MGYPQICMSAQATLLQLGPINDLDAMAGYHCIHLIVDDVDVQCASEKIEQPHSLGPPRVLE